MHFEMTDDRRMLADTLKRWLAEGYDVAHRNAVAYDAPFHDAAKWSQMAELGVFYALAPEAVGGMGGSGFDIATVFEELGRTICPEPVLGTVMAARLLTAAGADLEPLLGGSTRYAVAIGEPDAPFALEDISARAEAGVLTGRKSVVYGGATADRILVAARENGRLGVWEITASDAAITPYGMIDGGGAAEVMLDGTPANCLIADGEAALANAMDAGRVALCAEAVGAMGAAYDLLLDYLKTRKQFGRRIGDFQVLQHRTVDLSIEIEQARSITIVAAAALDEEDGARKVAMAKNLIGRVARLVAEETIQMHGGIAMTWEYPVSHYAKRLVMLDAQLGDTDYQLEKVMEGV